MSGVVMSCEWSGKMFCNERLYEKIKHFALLSSHPCKVILLTGPQGSGKSTFMHNLKAELLRLGQGSVLSLSLDDFYHSHSELTQLFQSTKQWVYEQRGLPGTHDLDLLQTILSSFIQPNNHQLQVPRYDKYAYQGRGDRCSDWEVWTFSPPAVLLLEGWCLGFPPILPHLSNGQAHFSIINQALEKQQSLLNELKGQIPCLEINFLVNDWSIVRTWRWQQESAAAVKGMSKAEVECFVDRFMLVYQHWGDHWKSLLLSSSPASPASPADANDANDTGDYDTAACKGNTINCWLNEDRTMELVV